MATNVNNIRRLKLLKRLGIIGLTISVFTITVFLILSFLPKGNSAFTIKIDEVSEESHFSMSSRVGGEPFDYVSATPMGETRTIEAREVEAYLNSLQELQGSQNYVDAEGKDRALIYTVYLTNTSDSEEQKISYEARLDNYSSGSFNPTNNANSPVDYLRILVRTSFVGSNALPENTYYGKARSQEMMNKYPGEKDIEGREPISSRKLEPVEDGLTSIYVKDFESNGNDGYCKNFDAYQLNGKLVSDADVTIPPKETLSFTFVAFFESKDLECDGNKPENAKILMSLHFGA